MGKEPDTHQSRNGGPRLRPNRRLGGPTAASTTPDELLEVLAGHHPELDPSRVLDAFRLAETAHRGARRRSGDPYISHPVEVAEITADLAMDEASVCAALLHDVVEDTGTTLGDIAALWPEDPQFAELVCELVGGLTKLDGIHFADPDQRRAADLRRLLVAIARDPRVLVVKLADRLHNMRTIAALPPAKQARIATETLEVFAPLAHRLGMGSLRTELEDLCFAVLHPEAHASVARSVEVRLAGIDDELGELTTTLSDALSAAGISAEVTWRVKHLWGIYSKMLRQRRSFEEIFDVVGVRVVVPDATDCYAAVGIIHAQWAPVPGRFRDFIANPRSNGYQSLHTTVRSPVGRAVEVQVRTHEMHEVAEYGVAAHWAYKESGSDAVADVAEVAWMRRLLDAAASDEQPQAYLGEVTGDLARNEIFCLTPKGRVVVLPEGATPVDFAYQVHTEIGDRAVAARVDGKAVGLDHRLRDGDRVEIVTSNDPNRGPNPAWVTWVQTPKARQLIRRWHTRARRREATEAGRVKILAALDRRAQRFGVRTIAAAELDDALERVRHRWGLTDAQTLTAAVGDGRVSAEAVAARLITEPPRPARPARPEGAPRVLIEADPDIEYHLAGCCSPTPPHLIVGWVTRGRGVSVHRLDCTNASGLVARDRDRIVAAEWGGAPPTLTATLTVASFDRPGLVAECTAVIARVGADIREASATTEGGLADQRYVISVGGSTALEEISNALWSLEGIIEVDVVAAD